MLKRGYLAAKVYRARRASAIVKRRLYCSSGVHCAYDVVEQKIEEENCIWSNAPPGKAGCTAKAWCSILVKATYGQSHHSIG